SPLRLHFLAPFVARKHESWGLLSEPLDVLEHAPMNAMDDHVGPHFPVAGRPHVVLVPGRPLKQRPAAGERRQQKLTLARDQKAFEMGWMNFGVRSQLTHRRSEERRVGKECRYRRSPNN